MKLFYFRYKYTYLLELVGNSNIIKKFGTYTKFYENKRFEVSLYSTIIVINTILGEKFK